MLKLKLQYFGHLMQLTHWKRPWYWEGLGAGGEGYSRVLDGWMASPTWWARVWVNSGSWWWTGRPGVLRFMGSQRVRYNWATELNWTELYVGLPFFMVAKTVKNLPVMWETRIWSLGQEDSLVKGMASYSSILAWINPWTEKPGRLQSMGSKKVGNNWAIKKKKISSRMCIYS